MTRTVHLVSGLPSTGKTSVCLELQARGYTAIDADQAIAFQSSKDWEWDKDKFAAAIDISKSDVVFICGSANNRDDFLSSFQKVFILHIDDDTMRYRLMSRTNNNLGKGPDVLARQIAQNADVKSYSEKRGRIVVDATQPLVNIVDEILSCA